jgi:hypothetical protein
MSFPSRFISAARAFMAMVGEGLISVARRARLGMMRVPVFNKENVIKTNIQD